MKCALELLEEPLLGGRELDEKLWLLLEGEYLRRLARHYRVENALRQKYGMEFQEFVAKGMVRESGTVSPDI